jgi:predicted nucleic acid-binding Zn ribbon protein
VADKHAPTVCIVCGKPIVNGSPWCSIKCATTPQPKKEQKRG